MKKISIGGLVFGLIATLLVLGGFFAVKPYILEEFLPAMGSSGMPSADYRMFIEVFDALQTMFVGLGVLNAIGAIFAGRKLGNVLLTIVGIFEILMLITFVPAILNFIAAGIGKKHAKKVNG